jgi:hypothetical protein
MMSNPMVQQQEHAMARLDSSTVAQREETNKQKQESNKVRADHIRELEEDRDALQEELIKLQGMMQNTGFGTAIEMVRTHATCRLSGWMGFGSVCLWAAVFFSFMLCRIRIPIQTLLPGGSAAASSSSSTEISIPACASDDSSSSSGYVPPERDAAFLGQRPRKKREGGEGEEGEA